MVLLLLLARWVACACRYVTYDDKLSSENPFFYCEQCYRPLHYSLNNELLYDDFRVYSYGTLCLSA